MQKEQVYKNKSQDALVACYRKRYDAGLNYKGDRLIQATEKPRSTTWLQVGLDLVTQQYNRGFGIFSPFLFLLS